MSLQLGRTELNLLLRVGDGELAARVHVPIAPICPADLLPVLQRLDDVLIDAAVETIQRQGKKVSCRAGCGACCRQLVPVSHTEAYYLAELLANLPGDRRARVLERFREAIEALRVQGLLDRLRAAGQGLDAERAGQLARDYFAAQVACPLLEDESCSIYPDRPLSCREYLVVSPAARCREPDSGHIEKVPLFAKPTQVLFRFDDGRGAAEPSWLPLALSVEWAVGQRSAQRPTLPGEEMLRNFLARLAEQQER